MDSLPVEVKILPNGEGLTLPTYATEFSAGADLYAAVDKLVTIFPWKSILIPTGIAIALPFGYEGQIRPRSGLAFDYGITVLNTPGTIDADYRGEIKVMLKNFGRLPFPVYRGDRIAQLIVSRCERVKWQVRDTLPQTERGEGGMGSTGER